MNPLFIKSYIGMGRRVKLIMEKHGGWLITLIVVVVTALLSRESTQAIVRNEVKHINTNAWKMEQTLKNHTKEISDLQSDNAKEMRHLTPIELDEYFVTDDVFVAIVNNINAQTDKFDERFNRVDGRFNRIETLIIQGGTKSKGKAP